MFLLSYNRYDKREVENKKCVSSGVDKKYRYTYVYGIEKFVGVPQHKGLCLYDIKYTRQVLVKIP